MLTEPKRLRRTFAKFHVTSYERTGDQSMYAGLFKRVELLDALKAKGADLNAEDPLGNSAARLANGEIRTAAPR